MKKTLVALQVCLCTVSCSWFPRAPQPKKVDAYFADARDISSVRRIMVLPFGEAPGVAADLERIYGAFHDELSKLQLFEIVPLPTGAQEDVLINQTLHRGRVSTRALVSLSERYNLDGIMMGTVTSYRAYVQPHLGMRVQLISIHSGTIVWAAEGLYDVSDARTMEDLRHYYLTSQTSEATRHGVEIYLISPTKFASYVSHRLVETWRPWIRSRP